MKLEFLFAWYDLWIGFFWDRKNKWLYILPLPMFGVILKFRWLVKHECEGGCYKKCTDSCDYHRPFTRGWLLDKKYDVRETDIQLNVVKPPQYRK